MSHLLLGDLELSLDLERQMVLDNEVPDQKVEGGENLSDNIKRKSDQFTFTVTITPERVEGERAKDLDRMRKSIKDQLNALRALRDERKVFRLVSPETVVDQAAVTSIQVVKSKQVSYSATVQVREIITVDKEETEEEGEQTDAGKRSDLDGDQDLENLQDENSPPPIEQQDWLLPQGS